MSEVNLRVANILKLFTMFLAISSLIYFYAYASDEPTSIYSRDVWLHDLSKTHIFYVGLGVFAVFNLIFSAGINMYKSTKVVDVNSFFLRSEAQKHRLLVWLTYLQAGVNYLIGSFVFYLALIKINEAKEPASYIYLPVSGLVALLALIGALIFLLLRKY